LVEIAADVSKGLKHQIAVYAGHAPDDGFHSPAVDRSLDQIG
jgi:hypothetical protein